MAKNNKYFLQVWIEKTTPINPPLQCILRLPNGQIVKSRVTIHNIGKEDPLNRYIGETWAWEDDDDGEKYYLAVDADSDVLSLLQFKFLPFAPQSSEK